MSEHDGGDSKTTAAFFLGFLLGCLLSLGGAGTYLVIHSQRARMQEMEARRMAEEARAQAEEARAQADRARLAEQQARKARAEADAARRKGKDAPKD
jgi:hypothetical protein